MVAFIRNSTPLHFIRGTVAQAYDSFGSSEALFGELGISGRFNRTNN